MVPTLSPGEGVTPGDISFAYPGGSWTTSESLIRCRVIPAWRIPPRRLRPEIKFYDTNTPRTGTSRRTSRTCSSPGRVGKSGDRRRGAERLPGGGGDIAEGGEELGGRKGRRLHLRERRRVEDLEPASSSAFRSGRRSACRCGSSTSVFPVPVPVVRARDVHVKELMTENTCAMEPGLSGTTTSSGADLVHADDLDERFQVVGPR